MKSLRFSTLSTDHHYFEDQEKPKHVILILDKYTLLSSWIHLANKLLGGYYQILN
jgi:hypothetical protein